MTKKQPSSERRRFKRIPILESFSVSAVFPGRGDLRLPIEDISEVGIGMTLSKEFQEHPGMTLHSGSQVDVHLYLNQSLYLPLKVRVVRAIDRETGIQLGMEFVAGRADAIAAVSHFVKMVDLLGQTATLG